MSLTRQIAVAVVTLCLGAGASLAQDSSRADWRTWFATRDSVARCRMGQLLSRVYGVEGEFTVHRTPTGGTCQAGPGPGAPTAWVIDSRLFCPDSNPTTWMDAPASPPMLDEKTVVSIETTRDSTVLASFRCGIAPRAAILVRTTASRSRPPTTHTAARSGSRWWLAAGVGGTTVPPVHQQALTLAAEIGAARGPLELVFHKSTGRAWGGSQRSGTALLLGASGAARFVAAHASLGAGRVSGCDQDGEASPCARVPETTGLAFRFGFDLFAAGALGLQLRYEGIGGGSQAYRPLTVGIVVGRLLTHPPWDRP